MLDSAQRRRGWSRHLTGGLVWLNDPHGFGKINLRIGCQNAGRLDLRSSNPEALLPRIIKTLRYFLPL